MTIERFMSNYGIKRRETVTNWIKNGLMPGANLQHNYIPDSARPPYTKARAKNTNAIYISLVKGAYNRRHIMPQLYNNMCEDEFNGYIDRLVEAGLIVRRVSDGITYYDATINANNINKKFILEALEVITRAASEGVANACFEQQRIGA